MGKIKFNCGCEFETHKDEYGNIRLNLDLNIENLPLDCKNTWELFKKGDTKGIFQLESPLGRSKSKQLQPENMEQLAALVSVLRPGPMESIIDGKSITEHYIERRHQREPITYYHKSLEPILKDTLGLMIYQEQAMFIVKDLAGFTLQEADSLRKAMGKKLPEEMARVKALFIEKAKQYSIVNEEEAKEIFSWIEKNQRYVFNKSHAVSYAYHAYWSAYKKAHYLRPFFTSYLFHSKEKAKPKAEIKELVYNAKNNGIEILPPDFRKINITSNISNLKPAKHFMLRDKKIYIGFVDVNGIGDKEVDKIINIITKIENTINKPHKEWEWLDFLLFCAPFIKTNVLRAIIEIGALSYMNLSRTKMLYEYDILQKLTDKELNKIKEIYIVESKVQKLNLTFLLKTLVYLGINREKGISNKNRLNIVTDLIKTLENPPYSLIDSAYWISSIEESLIGTAITCTKIDDKNINSANSTCQEFLNKKMDYYIIAAQIDKINEVTTKRGKNPGQKMAFLTINDSTGSLDSIVTFPDKWKDYNNILIDGNTVLIGGKRGKDNSLILDKVWQI